MGVASGIDPLGLSVFREHASGMGTEETYP